MTTTKLTAEQLQLINKIHKFADKFPETDSGNEQLLSQSYEYLPSFKRIMDTCTGEQMNAACIQYPGFYRFAGMLEIIAQSIRDGSVEVP